MGGSPVRFLGWVDLELDSMTKGSEGVLTSGEGIGLCGGNEAMLLTFSPDVSEDWVRDIVTI